MAKNEGQFNVQNVQMYVQLYYNGTSLSKSQSTFVHVRLLVYLNIQPFSPGGQTQTFDFFMRFD